MIKREGRVYSVYKHTNKLNGKIYIGLTCQTPERRWQKGAGYAGTFFGNAIKKYGWDAFAHEIIETGLTESEACEIERTLIAEYHSNEREFGYNLSSGGEVTDCIATRIGKDNPKAVAVVRIDTSTGERRIFESMSDATREMGINHRGISKACRGNAQTYMGYAWEYADGGYQKPEHYTRGKYPHTKQQKKVAVFETNGERKDFDSIGEACRVYKLGKTTVYRYLRLMQHDPYGRVWLYA